MGEIAMADSVTEHWRTAVAMAKQVAAQHSPGFTGMAIDHRAILFAADLIDALTLVNDENKVAMAKAHTDMDTLIRRWHNFAVDGEW